MKSTFRIYCTCRLPDTGDKTHSVMPGFTSYTCRDPHWTKSQGTFGFVANVISSGFSFCYLYSVSVVIPAYTLHIPGTHTMFCVFWTPDPTRKEGSGKYNLARKCPVGMSQFLNSANFLFQIFNAIGQVLLRFSKFLCYTVYSLPVIGLTRMLHGWLKWCSFLHQHRRRHSSTPDTSGQGFFLDSSSQVGSGVQTMVSCHACISPARLLWEVSACMQDHVYS